MNIVPIVGSIVIIGGIAGFLLYKRNQNKNFTFNEEVVDGELSFDDVLGFFKSLSLKQGEDVPFLANGDCEEFRKMLKAPYPKEKEGYTTLFIGVYNMKNYNLVNHKLIHASKIDSKIKEILGDEHLVVLS